MFCFHIVLFMGYLNFPVLNIVREKIALPFLHRAGKDTQFYAYLKMIFKGHDRTPSAKTLKSMMRFAVGVLPSVCIYEKKTVISQHNSVDKLAMLFEAYIRDFIRLLPSSRQKKEKEELRSILEQKRRILTKEEVAVCSAEVVEQILQSDRFHRAKRILLYYPIKNEIDLRRLFAEAVPDKQFFLPVAHRRSLELRQYTNENDLKEGRFGIPEPQTPAYKGKIDLILIPGVGFDKRLCRMGRGGGYYDRMLTKYRKAWKIGVGYAFQMVERVPHSRHDKKMNEIITAHSK